MMRLKMLAFFAFTMTFSTLFGQFSVTSTNGAYTVKVNFSNAVVVEKVNYNSNPLSYNYKIKMNYAIIITGTPPGNNMYDLRGIVHGPQASVGFNLPKSNTSSTGTVLTNTGSFQGNHNGNIQDVMSKIEMVFHWNQIPYQSITININPLPVTLIDFDVKAMGNQVNLNWSTATERDNDFFTIEKTIDGVNYETLGTIDGSGNSSSQKDYTYTDYNPSAGISYYRLKQTDYNGVSETFEPKAVEIAKMYIASNVYPNPALDSRINVMVAKTGDLVEINLYNMFGQIISTQSIDATTGNATQVLELPETGNLFFVELIQNNELVARHKVLTTRK